MSVIRRTRIKFFVVMAAIVASVVTAFCASILISTHTKYETAKGALLKNMVESFDQPNVNNPLNRFDSVRGFTVYLSERTADGISAFDTKAKASFSDNMFSREEIEDYVSRIVESGKTSGEIGDLRFLVREDESGIIIAAIDASMENALFRQLVTIVLLLGGGALILLFALVWFLSHIIIKPAADALNNQKRFISEAGHELKTPVTIISAGLELLEKNPSEENREKWLRSIREQVDRMNVITADLLALSKLGEVERTAKTEFDLSGAVLTEALAFESVAFESGKTLDCDIDSGINYRGNYRAVCQTVQLLCDNAVKYSPVGGAIEVSLKKSPRLVFSVTNACNTLSEIELPLLFERFYRGAESRASTKGTGLGLSILKTLAEQNGWRINTSMDKGFITFYISL